ncbi:unnamed protein product [Cyclocybe aegerita]|uniref:Uncharacterized protein n=1 Tax=Cyclocybe aegerita TaxID=1973307 RepID=A0A8S0WDM2_CYCAE|nr:unnamed protein product [Cyclocybe aegerita]
MEPEAAPTQMAEEGPMPVDKELQDSYADAYYECPMDSRELLAAEGIDDDFAWEGRGAMYDQRAPMVIWSDRRWTSVLYIVGSNSSNTHAKRITDAASNLHKKLCGLALVDHDYSDGWMAKKIRPKLADEPYKEVPMSCESLFMELHVSKNAEVIAYDLKVGYPNPMLLWQFIKNLNDPTKIQAVLSHQTPYMNLLDGYLWRATLIYPCF